MMSISRRIMMAASVTFLSPFSARAQQKDGVTELALSATTTVNMPDTEWRNYAGDLASTRYAPFDQINAENFSTLQVAWRFKDDALGAIKDGVLQATPLLANGRLYATAGSRRDVICLDAATGELLWLYRKDEGRRSGPRGGPGRGVGYWTDGTIERIFFVTVGYQLISLDAKTGLPDPGFGVAGIVDLRLDDDQDMDLANAEIGLHSAPLIVRDMIIIGAAHTSGVGQMTGGPKGYVRSFNVRSGRRNWIFHTIPRKGEFGYDSWIVPGQAEKTRNTGDWAQMSADDELGLVYLGVELPGGDTIGTYRQGNALFGESIVALDIETGERKWHYQLVHHGLWDDDVPAAAILCDVPVDGKIIKALAQPTKQSFLYVLDRQTGKPVWPIPERPVPKGEVPGEWYSPTQPIPSKPPAYDRQGVSANDLVDFTPEIKARALQIAAHYRMGPLFTPPVWLRDGGPWGTLCLPGFEGGANWPGGSYDPDNHMVYIFSRTVLDASGVGPAADTGTEVRPGSTFIPETRGTADNGPGGNSHIGTMSDALDAPITKGLLSVAGLPLVKPPYGRISAIDLSKGTLAWQVAHGETPDAIRNHPLLKGLSIPRTGQAGMLGVLTTKSLVICGDGGLFTDDTGRKGARLRAYDKRTGEEKGAVFLPAAQRGGAMTYMLKGQQYIVTTVSSGPYGSELIAHRLPV